MKENKNQVIDIETLESLLTKSDSKESDTTKSLIELFFRCLVNWKWFVYR